jgi:glucosylceramidase
MKQGSLLSFINQPTVKINIMKRIIPIVLLSLTACVAKQPPSVTSRTSNHDHQFTTAHKQIIVYTTAENTNDRLTVTDTLHFNDFGQPVETQVCIFIDPAHTFQTFLGIGGAITDAAAETFYKLPEDKQQEILQAYYDTTKGIGYTLARTTIGSCDFSSGSYTYVADNDTSLKTFSVAHDEKYRIPLIKAATREAGGKLTLFASPWSPPAWMKDNHNLLHGGHLLPRFYQDWANYFVKFIQAYKKEGINIWGVTVQNEPMANQTWESCIYTADMERDFVKNNLGPTFRKDGLGDKKIIIWDHNRDLMYQRASTVLNDSEAAKYVWGVGFHWYMHHDFDNVKRVHEAFPHKHLLFTEACNYPFDLKKINDWNWGENYGLSMIHDFNNGTVGWTDWNILLDQRGGPNHVGNYCYAPIHADTATGRLYYMNAYYYIGHFSKFIRPGAKRIISSSNRDSLLTTAFVNPDGKIAVVVLNLTDDKMPYYLWVKGKAAQTISLPHSIQTLVIE